MSSRSSVAGHRSQPVAPLYVGVMLAACAPHPSTSQPTSTPKPSATIRVPPAAASRTPPPATPDPWQQLRERQLVFAAPAEDEVACAPSTRAIVLLDSEAPPSQRLASQAGCWPVQNAETAPSRWCCPDSLQPVQSLRSGSGKSCELAQQEYLEQSPTTAPAATDPSNRVTAGLHGAVLNAGSYFAHCGIPNSMGIHICAAIQHGKALGVSVHTLPPSVREAECVAEAVRKLSFAEHPLMDITLTRF